VLSHFRQNVREVLRAGQVGRLDLYLELITGQGVVDGIYYCAREGWSTGLPATKAQTIEDSNDGAIAQVRYFVAVIVGTMCEGTHVQSGSFKSTQKSALMQGDGCMVVQGQWNRQKSARIPKVELPQTRSLTASETGNTAVRANQRLVAVLRATLTGTPNSSNDVEGFLTFCDNGMCRLQIEANLLNCH
jgi:hypothetical protein